MTPREKRILRKYGLTPEEYAALYEAQHGLCAVCRRPLDDGAVVVDHDHKEKRVRGLLDRYCNKFVVGRHRVGLNGVALLRGAGDYLADPPAWYVPRSDGTGYVYDRTMPKTAPRRRNVKSKSELQEAA